MRTSSKKTTGDAAANRTAKAAGEPRAQEHDEPGPQASTNPPAKKPAWRRVATALVLIAVFVVANVLVCLALEPYGAHTEVVWSEYRKAEGLDTVVAGASTAAYDFDPRPFDQKLGSTAFNMGTPGQSLDNTLASIEQASRDHDLKRVVLCLGYDSLAGAPYINSSVVFTQAKCLGESPAEALGDIGRMLFFESYFPTMGSLSCMFPWTYNHVEYTPEAVARNVRARANADLMAASKEYSNTLDGFWYYESQGYGGVRTVMKPTFSRGQMFATYRDVPFNETNVSSYTQICAFCKEAGIALYVVACPYTYSTLLELKNVYLPNMSALRQIAQESGAHYLDMNMIHRDVLALNLNSYFDWLHLNQDGAAQLSAAVASLVERIEKGEDVSGLFYDYTEQGWQAYSEGIDYVDSLDFTYTVEDAGTAQLDAFVRAGSSLEVSYQLEVLDPETGAWSVARAFSTNPHMTLHSNGKSSANVRIYARAANGPQSGDPYVEGVVQF